MSSKPSALDRQLADAAYALYEDGVIDPHVSEILEKHYGGAKMLRGMAERYRGTLRRIRIALIEDRNVEVVLLSDYWYEADRSTGKQARRLPEEISHRRKCLANLNGGIRRAAGLYFPQNEDDPLVLVHATYRTAMAVGTAKGYSKYMSQQIEAGALTEEETRKMLKKKIDELSSDQLRLAGVKILAIEEES